MPEEEQKTEELNEQQPVKYDTPNEAAPDFAAQEPSTPTMAHPELAITKPPKQKSKKKRILIIILILVLLGGGAAAYWYFELRDEPISPQAQTTTETLSPQVKEVGLNTLIYSVRNTAAQVGQTDSEEVFWQPVDSDVKNSALKPSKNSYVTAHDVSGNKSVLALAPTNSTEALTVWYSADGGKEYKNIYSSPKASKDNLGYQLTSLKFSSDGSSVIFGLLPPGTDTGNEVYVIDLESADFKGEKLFTSEKRGVFIYAYEADLKKVIYSEGCYNCDGNIGNDLLLFNAGNNTKSTLAKSNEGNVISFQAINNDFSEILTLSETRDSNMQVTNNIDGTYMGPPFTISALTLQDGSSKAIGTFGEKLKPDATGNVDYLFITAGYMEGGTTPYVGFENKIYKIADSNILMYEASKTLTDVLYVGEDNIVAASGELQDFALNNFSVKDKTSNIILNGNERTTLFGVTRN